MRGMEKETMLPWGIPTLTWLCVETSDEFPFVWCSTELLTGLCTSNISRSRNYSCWPILVERGLEGPNTWIRDPGMEPGRGRQAIKDIIRTMDKIWMSDEIDNSIISVSHFLSLIILLSRVLEFAKCILRYLEIGGHKVWNNLREWRRVGKENDKMSMINGAKWKQLVKLSG